LDHSKIEYAEFNKEFYEEHPDIASMDAEAYRKQLSELIFSEIFFY